MMYNRYVPDAAGVYRPTRVEDISPRRRCSRRRRLLCQKPRRSLRRRVRRCLSGRMRAASCRGCCRAASTREIC
ncbi:MAG: hypothetical protein ACLUFI_05475 [Oscillospiraceae bacterium]